jgi:hypothetical protein
MNVRHTDEHVSAPAPRVPVDPAKVGRSSVRHRARGIAHGEAVAALEETELDRALTTGTALAKGGTA